MNNFAEFVKESKTIQIAEKKEFNRVSKKKLVKTRLAQLYCMGCYSNRQIADILSISTTTVNKMLRNSDVVEMITNYQDEEKTLVDAKLKAMRNKALDTVSELLDSEEDSVRLQASKDILDRTGHGKETKQDININVSYEERLQQLKASVDTSFLIDAEYEVK